jgi:tetratricopeptide (TPR) repeat protein
VNKGEAFDKAVCLRQERKYREAAELFLDLSNRTDNVIEKAGMLLNVVQMFKEAGNLEQARRQLHAAREVLCLPPHARLLQADEENLRRLTIGVELESARISAGEGKLPEALAQLKDILAKHQSELNQPTFAEIYQAVERDRAFLLTDLGACPEALPLLEEVDATDPHDQWTLFYLGYCYLSTRKYAEAQRKLEEAIQLGLTPEFEGRAHCALGAACYELKDYARAKSELESGVKTASPRYIKEAHIWQLLEYTCISLGLKAEAEVYRSLARAS